MSYQDQSKQNTNNSQQLCLNGIEGANGASSVNRASRLHHIARSTNSIASANKRPRLNPKRRASLFQSSASVLAKADLNPSTSPSTSQTQTPASKSRWLCSVAESVKFQKNVARALSVRADASNSQYDLMVKLLKAETCDVIYFDCHLSASQIAILKMLQMFSKTELVHARLAMQFSKQAS